MIKHALALGLTGLALAAAPALAAPSLTVVDRWAGPDGGWDFSSFDPVHRRLYISRPAAVTAVDVDTGKVTPALLTAGHTHAAVPVNAGSDLLVTDAATGSALIADAATGQVRVSIKTGKKPDAAMVEPTTGFALVMDNAGGGVALIDTAKGVLAGSIAAEGNLESAVDDGAGHVFINVEDKNEIVVLDMKARSVSAHYALPGCDGPTGLAYAPPSGLLIAACDNGMAKVVDARTGAVVKTLAIGLRPDGAMYDPARKLAVLPTGADGVINLISVAKAEDVQVVAKPAGRVGSRSGAIDPKTGRIFLPSARFETAKAGARPSAAPGSFEVMVLDWRP